MSSTPVILITGASTGLGLALAKQLIHAPYRLVLTARKESLIRFPEEGFEESDRLWFRALDVTHYEAQEQLIEEINAQWGGVDVLINNAGIMFRSVMEHIPPKEALLQFETNYFGPMNLARLVLPKMREKRRGHIINISSVGGMMAMPTMGAYSGSKFALEGASEALWYEARPWGVRVSLIEPGFVHSNAFRKVLFTEASCNEASDPDLPYYPYYYHMSRFTARLMNRAIATPESIAKRIIKVMHQKHPALRVPITIDAWLFYFLRRLLPRSVYHRVLYRLLPHIKDWGSS